MEFGTHTAQQTQRTFACASLLRTCYTDLQRESYGESGVMELGFHQAVLLVKTVKLLRI